MKYLAYIYKSSKSRRIELLFVAALISFCIAAIVSVQSLTSALTTSMTHSLKSSAGGDILVTWTQKLDYTEAQKSLEKLKAVDRGLSFSLAQQQLAVVANKDSNQFQAVVRIVDSRYPLLNGTVYSVDSRPEKGSPSFQEGTALLTEELAERAKVRAGEPIKISFGDGSVIDLNAGKPVRFAQQRSTDEMITGTVLLSRDNFPKDVQTSMKVNEAYILTNRVKDIKQDLADVFPTAKISSFEDVGKENAQKIGVLSTLQAITSALLLLLVSLSILSTIRSDIEKRTREIGILEALGLSYFKITSIFITELLVIGLISGIAGTISGSLLSRLIFQKTAYVLNLPADNWTIDPRLIFFGLALGVLFSFILSLPAIWRISKIAPADAIRGEKTRYSAFENYGYLLVIGLLFAEFAILFKLTAWDFVPVVLLYFAISLTAAALLALVMRFPFRSVIGRLIISNIKYTKSDNLRSICVLAVGFTALTMALLFSTQVKTTISKTTADELGWDVMLSVDSQNEAQVKSDLSKIAKVKDVVESRLASVSVDQVDGKQVASLAEEVAKSEVSGAINFEAGKFVTQLLPKEKTPEDSVLTAGFSVRTEDDTSPIAFVIEPVAKRLNIKPDSTILLDFGGLKHSARVVGIKRKQFVNMASIILPENSLSPEIQWPRHVFLIKTSDQSKVANELHRKYPKSLILTRDSITTSVNKVISNGAYLFNVLATLAFFASLIIMANGILLGVLRKRRELALVKVVGANVRDLWKMVIAENTIIGLLGALIGAILGNLLAEGLGKVLNMPISFNVLTIAFSLVLGLFISLAISVIFSRSAIHSRPLPILRNE